MSTKTPSTAALRILRKAGVRFEIHRYEYQEHGGAEAACRDLGISLHEIVKSIVLEDDRAQPLMVLMHGDRQISAKQLARALGVKQISPCTPATARRATGYQVGGTSPLGTRTALPVYAEESIAKLETLCINGGARGLLVELRSRTLLGILRPVMVSVGISLSQCPSAVDACR